MSFTIICSRPANEVNLIVIDTEADSLEGLKGIPHLSHPIVKDRDIAAYVIQSLKGEMNRRYGIESSQRNNLPEIVCVIDEFVTFMDNIDNKQQRQTVISNISNLLRLGRKTKVHR